jgi:hypothetical protein
MGVKQMNRILVLAVAAGAVGYLGASLAFAEGGQIPFQIAQAAQQMDTAPGPAFETIYGTVTKIEGEIYTVQQPAANDYVASGMKADEVRVYVGKETKKIRGEKKVGDRIRAEVTRGGFANSIQ